MAHFVLAATKIHDFEKMGPYIARIKSVLEQFGGEIIFAGACEETLEGSTEISSGVLIEFADAAAAKRWYDSPDYLELRALRRDCSDARMWLLRPMVP